jgi:Spy/CpxP family protein refolding chaperone
MNQIVKAIIIFVVGVLLGVAGTGLYIHHCFARAWINTGNHNHAVDMLASKLNLTDDEKTKVAKVFDDNAPAVEAVRLETNAKLQAIRDKTSVQIRLLLTSDQQQKYDSLKAEWDKKRNANDKGWHIPGLPPGPPPGGPGTIGCSGPDSATPSSK